MKETKKVFMSDPLISAIQAPTSQEPFVNLFNFDPDIVVDCSLESRSHYFSFVRLSIAQKLSQSKKILAR